MPKSKTTMEQIYGCGCGCGNPATRRFLPGHDAKLKSSLLKRFRAGGADAAKAEAEAKGLGWAHFMTLAPTKVNGTKTSKTSRAAAPTVKPGFNPVRVKIGRWTYDAVILSEDVNALTVRYQPKGKQAVVKQVKRSQLVNN